MSARVVAVHRSSEHAFSKNPHSEIQLLAGLGVADDAHRGVTVQHRSRLQQHPSQKNLRQVHLIHSELFAELRQKGFNVNAGQLGENITTRNIDLLLLPTNALLHIGVTAVIQITGLRNPCLQIHNFQRGLLAAVLTRDHKGKIIRKAGVMAVVIASGAVKPNDAIDVENPPRPHQALVRV